MKKRNLRVLAATLTAAMVATGFTVPALAATTWSYTMPTSTISVNENNLTTLTQRAASEIAAVYGVNVMGGNMFTGLQYLAGTDSNTNPDPYIYNYNASQNGVELGDDDVAYQALGNAVSNPNGLYQSGGGNQAYVTAISQYGSAGYAIGMRSDVIFSFNSALVSQITWVNSLTSDSEYYQEGDETYNPLMADVSTGNVTSRLYSWSDNGQALSRYLDANEDKTVRYQDPAIEGEDVEAFSAGICYYISALIANGTIEKKTVAYTSAYSDGAFTCIDPDSNGDVRSDTYGEVDNFNFLDGTYTLKQLMQEGVDIIIFNGTGYSYSSGTGSSDNAGSTSATMDKSAVLTLLAKSGYTADEMPLVMDSNITSVQFGNNGYNYSPVTPMFMPYVQVYAYFEELEEVNPAINPAAMVQFCVAECFEISDTDAAGVASYYIGSNWDTVDEEYDRVPDTSDYWYDEEEIIAAIQFGASYALSGYAEENNNVLTGAYSTADTAYQLLTESLDTDYIYIRDTQPSGTEGEDYYAITLDDGSTIYIVVAALLSIDEDATAGDGTIADGQYSSTTQSFEAIMEYYDGNGIIDDFATTLTTYASRINYHVWEPETETEGTYLYGVTADAFLATVETEDEETGEEETGDEETGDEETGDEETGDEETGDEETGDEETGEEETGEEETGDEETGDEETGDEETGDEETGEEETGDEETGDEETGDEETGDEETGDEETGDAEDAEGETDGESSSDDSGTIGDGTTDGGSDSDASDDTSDTGSTDVSDSSGSDSDSGSSDSDNTGSTETGTTDGDSSTDSSGSGSTGGSTTGSTGDLKAQTITAKATTTKKIKATKLKKKKVTFKISASTSGNGKVTFAKKSGSAKLKISKKGKVTVKKGTYKKGKTLKMKVTVKAAATSTYKAATKTITVKVKIK